MLKKLIMFLYFYITYPFRGNKYKNGQDNPTPLSCKNKQKNYEQRAANTLIILTATNVFPLPVGAIIIQF